MRPEAPEKRPRRNHEIRVPRVRLIGEDGKQRGVVTVREAIDAADEVGLDLIEVSPEADPPVCRIMDWGRYRYEQKQRERDQRRKQRSLEVKGLRLRPSTDEHDFMVTRRKAEQFLRQGHKVRVEVRFRGREITHRELGTGILIRLAEAVEEVGEIETQPSMEGRKMFLIVAPRPEAIGTRMSAEDEAAMALDEAEAAARGEEPDDEDEADEVAAAEPGDQDEGTAAVAPDEPDQDPEPDEAAEPDDDEERGDR